MSSWDELLAEARQALSAQHDMNSDLGDDMTPAPEASFMGRWRNDALKMTTSRGVVDVYGVWDRDGKPGFLYRHTRLVDEVDAQKPQIGDQVLVLRGADEEYEKAGETRTVYPYVLRKRACDDPLPDQPALGAGSGAAADEDIPFLCLARSASRSVRSAAGVTVSA